jgi:hypothetical protein
MATVTVILYHPVIEHMRGWDGDIGRSVFRLAQGMAQGQRMVSPKKTGALTSTIGVGERQHWARGIAISVGANPGTRRYGYAWWTSEGAAPHRIVPRPSNRTGLLTFFWAKVGYTVRLRSVNHPGVRYPTHWVMGGAQIGMRAWK